MLLTAALSTLWFNVVKTRHFLSSFMAQSVKHLTLHLVSGHDLNIHVFDSVIRLCVDGLGICADGMESALDSLSLSLFSCPSFVLFSLSLSLSLSLCLPPLCLSQ